MLESQPQGSKNPLRRNCNECCATDKALNRRCPLEKPSKGNAAKRKSQELAQAEQDTAKKIKADLAVMTPSDKAAWYAEQADKRKQEEKKSSRTFATSGQIHEYQQNANLLDEVDAWQTFNEWAMEQMILKKVTDLKAAEELWLDELGKPGNMVTKVRGQYLLGKFKGLERRNRSGRVLEAGYKQHVQIDDEADMEIFDGNVDAIQNKVQRRYASGPHPKSDLDPTVRECDIDRLVASESISAAPSVLQSKIHHDMETQMAELKEEELRLYNEAIDLNSKREEVESARQKEREAPKILAVEKLAFKTACSKAQVVFDATVNNWMHQVEGVHADCAAIMCGPLDSEAAKATDAELANSWKIYHEGCKDSEKPLRKHAEELMKTQTDRQEEDTDAEGFHQYNVE